MLKLKSIIATRDWLISYIERVDKKRISAKTYFMPTKRDKRIKS